MKHRKINKAKHVSNGCRNNGSCEYCRGSRTHSNRRREPLPDVPDNIKDGPLARALRDIEASYTVTQRRHIAGTFMGLARESRALRSSENRNS